MVQIVQPSSQSHLKRGTMRLNLYQYQKLVNLNVKIQKITKNLQQEEEEEDESERAM